MDRLARDDRGVHPARRAAAGLQLPLAPGGQSAQGFRDVVDRTLAAVELVDGSATWVLATTTWCGM